MENWATKKLGNEKWKGMKKGQNKVNGKMGNRKLDTCYSPCCHNNNAAVGLYYVGLLKTRDYHRLTTD